MKKSNVRAEVFFWKLFFEQFQYIRTFGLNGNCDSSFSIGYYILQSLDILAEVRLYRRSGRMNRQVMSLFLVDIPAEMLVNGAEDLRNVYGQCVRYSYKNIQQCREHIETDLSMPTS